MNLVMYRGDDRDFPVTLTDDGVPINLTDYTVVFTARADIDDATAVFSLSSATVYGGGHEIDIDPDQVLNIGKVIVHVPASATIDLERGVTLLCDMQLTDGNGKVRTAPEPDFDGSTLIRLKIRADVTR